MKKILCYIVFISSIPGGVCVAQSAGVTNVNMGAMSNGAMNSVSASASGNGGSNYNYGGNSVSTMSARETYSNPAPEPRYNTGYSTTAGRSSSEVSPAYRGFPENMPSYSGSNHYSSNSGGGNSMQFGYTFTSPVAANNSVASSRYQTTGAFKYNFAAQKPCVYYSSGDTRDKSKTYRCDTVHMNCQARRPLCYAGSALCYDAIASCAYFYDNAMYYDEHVNGHTEVQYISLDGYAIYHKDTLQGIITFDDHSVFIEAPIGANTRYANEYYYKDTALAAVVVFLGARELHLTRFSGGGNHLWRIVHTGKLTIYDDRFSLLSMNNIDKKSLTVICEGKVMRLRAAKGISMKEKLANCVNMAYGLHLQDKDYTWKELLSYIDTLD